MEQTLDNISHDTIIMGIRGEVDEQPDFIPDEESEFTVDAEMEGEPVEEPLPPTIHAGLEG